MEIDTSNLTDEQISKLSEFIHTMENENKSTKWWIMPNFDCFEEYNPSIGLNYFIEPQEDSYSRNRPPLKSDFESKEAAEKWLNDYLEQEEIFKSAINDIDNLVCNLSHIRERLRKHEYIGKGEWKISFELFDESLNNGVLHHVMREE